MTWRVLLLSLLLPLGAAWGQQPDPQKTFEDDRLLKLADRAARKQELPKAINLLEQLTTSFPGSRHAKLALRRLAQLTSQSQDAALRAKGLTALRTLHTVHDRTAEEHQRTLELARQLGRWRWSTHESGELAPGGKLVMDRGHNNRVESVLTVYRIPRKTFADDPTREFDHRVAATIKLEDAWRVADRRVAAARNRRKHGRVALAADTQPVGMYVVVESIRGFRMRTPIEVRGYQLYCRYVGGSALLLAYDHRSNEPLAGVEVRQLKGLGEEGDEGWQQVARGVTDADGLARFRYQGPTRFVAQRDKESHVVELEVYRPEEESPRDLVHVSTDRPIYRPGQTIHYKAIHRKPAGDKLERASGKAVSVELRDPRGRLLGSRQQSWSELGTVTGSFLLPEEPALGRYSVLVRVLRYGEDDHHPYYFEDDDQLNRYWQARIRVAEYRKPEMEVKVGFSGSGFGGGKVKARISATYFSGGKVAGGEVKWRVERTWAWDWRRDSGWPRLPFEDPLAWFYERKRDRPQDEEPDDEGMGTTIARGTGKLGPDGTLEVSFDTRSYYWPEDYVLYAEVRDLSRLTAEAKARLKVEPSSLGITVGADRMFYMPGEPFTAKVRVRDLEGEPIRNGEVELVLFEGVRRDRELEFEQSMATRVTTDAEGYASWDVKAPAGSRLRIRARVKDGEGRVSEDRADLLVVQARQLGPDGDPDEIDFEDADEQLYVLPDRVAYRAGETARLLVRSEIYPCTVWMSVEGQQLHAARRVRLTRYEQVIELPLEASYGHHLRVVFFGWHEREIRGGAAELFVVSRKPLEVRVEADQSRYRPRDKARLVITTLQDGKPVPAEVELAVVDRAILSLERERTPELRGFFDPLDDPNSERFPHVASAGSDVDEGLHFCDVWAFDDRPEGRRRPSSGSVGAVFSDSEAIGGHPEEGEAAASAGFAATSTRRWFPDTMFYAGRIMTDASGRAVIEVEMPDSLTRWRVLARGLSTDDRFGQVISEVLCRKPVVLRLSTPRFYTQGDKGVVTTVIHNRQPIDAQFTVKLTVDGEARTPRTITVAAGELARVDWPVEARRHGVIAFKAEALSKTASDAIAFELPVKVFGFRTHLIRSGRSRDGWQTELELPEQGQRPTLELSASRSGLNAVTQALPTLVGYPYGCVEQTMSRFLPSLVAARALKRLGIKRPQLTDKLPSMVEAGVRRLVNFQHEDGGWGWWKHDESDERMTAYVLFGLVTARDAGFKIDDAVIKRGYTWLAEQASTPFAHYALALVQKPEAEELEAARDLLEGNRRPISARAYLVLAGDKGLADELVAATPASATPLSVQTTALVIRALASVDPKDKRIPLLVDWLLRARRGAAWFSTLDSAYAIFALTAVMADEPETQPTVTLGGAPVKLTEGRALLSGEALAPGKLKVAAEGNGYVAARLSYFETRYLEKPSDSGIVVRRRFEKLVVDKKVRSWIPIASGATLKASDELRVVIEVSSPKGASRVMIDCPIPAGSEARASEPEDYDWYGSWYVRREMRDDKVCLAATRLGEKVNRFTFRLRPTMPGTYRVLPAHAFGMYDPDVYGRSAAFTLTIED